MENKKSRAIPTMAAVSAVIFVLGVLCAIAFYSAVTHEIAQGADSALVLGGIDIVPAAGAAGNAGAAVLSVLIAAFSFVLIAVQWAAYLIVRIIMSAVRKSKTRS